MSRFDQRLGGPGGDLTQRHSGRRTVAESRSAAPGGRRTVIQYDDVLDRWERSGIASHPGKTARDPVTTRAR